jgi:hypothetical protein
MAAPAVTAEEVGQILTYLAPGFFAQAAYRYRFPRRRRSDFDAIVLSVVLSVPLVAVGNAAANGLAVDRDVGDVVYVFLLLGISVVLGYLTAILRSTQAARVGLGRLAEDALIYVNFNDGRAVAGNPSAWTFDPEASTRDLYVHFPQWWRGEDAGWSDPDDDGGVLFDLSEVHSIQVTSDPIQVASARGGA